MLVMCLSKSSQIWQDDHGKSRMQLSNQLNSQKLPKILLLLRLPLLLLDFLKTNLDFTRKKFSIMVNITAPEKQWEEELISSFLDMVRTTDADFTVLAQLTKASSDSYTFQTMVERLSATPRGKEAFKKRFTLGEIDLEALSKLPADTLGCNYAKHMKSNNLQPMNAPQAENNYQFLGNHLTETHDIWHVITGSKTDILGEIQLEAFYVAQLEVSRFWLALLAKNLLKATVYKIDHTTQYIESLTNGWTMGRKAKPLFGIDWNEFWETPLSEIRTSFDIKTCM